MCANGTVHVYECLHVLRALGKQFCAPAYVCVIQMRIHNTLYRQVILGVIAHVANHCQRTIQKSESGEKKQA
jgi:hypothetical protein